MYQIIWKPQAEEQLAAIWIEHPFLRDYVTKQAHLIDIRLKGNPLLEGESRAGATRVAIFGNLVVFFDVIQDDLRVEILAIRYHEFESQ